MIAYIHCSVLGISGHRCGPSLSPSSGLDVKRCPGSSSFSLVRTWSPVLIHAQGRLWCKVKEKGGGGGERKKGREWVIVVLSQISPLSVLLTSQHADSHLELLLVMLWQIYVRCALCTLSFLCGVEGNVQSQNWHQVKRQNGRQGGVQVLMGDKYCRVDGKQPKERRRHLFFCFYQFWFQQNIIS